MDNTRWILVGVRKAAGTGEEAPPELGAQRMRGWDREGAALNRTGESLSVYAGCLPLVTLRPPQPAGEESHAGMRLARPADGQPPAFSAYTLAERLLDPLPVGGCLLQTLQFFFRLPERGVRTVDDEVQSMADLMAAVLHPIAERQGLTRWEQLVQLASAEWYPSRIAFGKYQGRPYRDAADHPELRQWLEWLAGSSIPRSARIGRWYLLRLRSDDQPAIENQQLHALRQRVDAARERLRDAESRCREVQAQIEALHRGLFSRLSAAFRQRALLQHLAEFRRQYLDALVNGNPEEAGQGLLQLEAARLRTEREYQETQSVLEAPGREPPGREAELAVLWRQLVKRFHPDRFANQPEKMPAFEQLTGAVNQAKDEADLLALQEILADPDGYMRRRGWPGLELSDGREPQRLQPLLEDMQLQAFTAIEWLNRWRESPDYELCGHIEKRPGLLDELTGECNRRLTIEMLELEKQADRLAEEIIGLAGRMPEQLN